MRLLVCSGLVAAPGTVLLGAATSTPLALAGITLTGIGISVAAPTLYGVAGRSSPERDRGRTIATVSGVAYVGLLGGPGLVGQVAGATSLNLALALLAPATLVLALGAGLLAHRDPAVRRANRQPGADRTSGAGLTPVPDAPSAPDVAPEADVPPETGAPSGSDVDRPEP